MESQLKIWVNVPFLLLLTTYLSGCIYLLTAISLIIWIGAKYGGYGSFLSMYQRSPACKSPPQVVRPTLKLLEVRCKNIF